MNIYVWENIDGVSTSYHDGGGLMVVADSLEQARQQIIDMEVGVGLYHWCEDRSTCDNVEHEKQSQCEALTKNPDHWWLLHSDHAHAETKVIAFPDSGCC